MIWRKMVIALALLSAVAMSRAETEREAQFQKVILPLLDNYCYDCHEPGLSKGDVPFLEAETTEEISEIRGVWRSVASQLRNRTMPPPEKRQPEDEERAQVAEWIEQFLADTACGDEPYVGNVTARRLNRLEYDNTVRDLIGLDLGFSEKFPMDGGTGEGFDNNGESLFLQPMLMERYLEAAQQIVDAAIVSPPLTASITIDPETGVALQPFYTTDASYEFVVRAEANWPEKPDAKSRLLLKIDGVIADRLVFSKSKEGRAAEARAKIAVGRGVRAISVERPAQLAGPQLEVVDFRLVQAPPAEPSKEMATAHQTLLGVVPGVTPQIPRTLAERQLKTFARRAFRRPIREGEMDRFLALYDRAAERGDPWEEAMKLALKGIFVAPDFLFRLEIQPETTAPQLITEHELASRLSYFLWATMPDPELMRLADEGKLRGELDAQIDRMIDDPQLLVMVRNFVGQWLGTKEVGGRVAPLTNGKDQDFYTPDVAADLREEVVIFTHHLLRENRKPIELVEADYTFLTQRLAKFYQLPDQKNLKKEAFTRVSFDHGRRGGLLGSGAVLALTAHGEATPIIRGAWVFDTLIGEPVPPPPANVPELPKAAKKNGRELTVREKFQAHRERASCMACHQIIDPIGFALQNYDQHGRWRNKEKKQSIDTKGKLPTGETFEGPAGLRRVLLEKRGDQITRHVTKKLLGYALGRSLSDRDDCTLSKLIAEVESEKGGLRTLVKGIANSDAFQNRQVVE